MNCHFYIMNLLFERAPPPLHGTSIVKLTINWLQVGYEAGSNGEKLPPLYMKSLDDELVAVVHQAALSSQENPAVLELVFRVMEQG